MFSLEEFVKNPSLELLNVCRKQDLFLVADHFKLLINKQDCKAEVKQKIRDQLLELNVLLMPNIELEETADHLSPGDEVFVSLEMRDKNVCSGRTDANAGVEAVADAGVGLPPFEPFSPLSVGSRDDARLKVRLARLHYDSQEHTRRAELDLRLQIRKLEIEAETQVRLRQLELDASRKAVEANQPGPVSPSNVSSVSLSSSSSFDVSKHIALVPQFRESEVDSYFNAFERIATSLRWPLEFWSLLLQCKFVGKALEVYSTLSLEESLKYDSVKSAILRAYELVPEAYRQKFRTHRKTPNQTFVEFAREKGTLFDKWCVANNVADLNSLRELVLLEEFKNCLPEKVVVYLNEQKVNSLSQAAVLADEFILTHKNVFVHSRVENAPVVPLISNTQFVRLKNNAPRVSEERDCFYCHKKGHVVVDCLRLKRKQNSQAKPVGFVKTCKQTVAVHSKEDVDEMFRPFILKGLVSLTGSDDDQKEITMLRDTGSTQSFIVESAMKFSDETSCHSSVLVQGIEMGCVKRPLHNLHLKSDLCSGLVRVAVCTSLPMKGVDLILGNDLAGGKVMPLLEVLDKPSESASDELGEAYPHVFPACAVTRAQSRKEIALNDSFFSSVVDGEENLDHEKKKTERVKNSYLNDTNSLILKITREELITAQKKDETLTTPFNSVVPHDLAKTKQSAYILENDLLMRKWCSSPDQDEWDICYQVVVPVPYRPHVLCLAHDHPLSGHLGIRKTYNRILKHFFWPGLKSDVTHYCRSCNVCQIAGKPNQVVSPAPLNPIPVLGEPFEHVLIDCVGPLKKSKSGNQFLLTVMCLATRFPEAIPLRKISTPVVVKALVKFFSTFGLPKVVQSDQGTNFTSKLFNQVMQTLGIKHRTSTAFHPESQGALERCHQTLKSMLRKYCMQTGNEWDDGIPMLLFAIRGSVQESLGFSPAELVFGHQVRGPLKVLKDQILEKDSSKVNVLEYVTKFRKRLHTACSVARESLANAQKGMKRTFDKKAVMRSFKSGDLVLIFLPIPGSSLSTRFFGPYVVKEKLSETNYAICTPDRKRKVRVCHVNMLKLYHSRSQIDVNDKTSDTAVISVAVVVEKPVTDAEEDGVMFQNTSQTTVRLCNSVILKDLDSHLTNLSVDQKGDLVRLISEFGCLFKDVPALTNVIQHDIDVKDASSIRQHAYRVNSVKRSVMRQEVDYLLKNGLAKPSSSSWSSPCILVPKPDGSFRFCTDFRKVNSLTVPDNYPLPRMEDCVDNVGYANFVSKLDMLKGYWQVPLTSRASDIAAFITPDSFAQYTAMAFGLRNAPATFQRLVNTVLAGIPNCSAYLDDVVVYSRDWDEHMKSLRAVFERFASASLTLNLAKCEFGQAKVMYLGKEVGHGQVRPVEVKVEAISKFPVPTTRRELRRFLGMAGYYRSFCRNFSSVVSPLTSLLSPSTAFVWSAECQYAFESVKTLLSSSPVLAAPDLERPFKLEVDASNVGAGAVLLQDDEQGVPHPVSYFSRKFNKNQLNYSVIEKETLALIFALQHFEVYVGSSVQPLVVFTDHSPLTFLSKLYNHNQRLTRWSLFLQSYNLDIRHKRGVDNVLADALSRV